MRNPELPTFLTVSFFSTRLHLSVFGIRRASRELGQFEPHANYPLGLLSLKQVKWLGSALREPKIREKSTHARQKIRSELEE